MITLEEMDELQNQYAKKLPKRMIEDTNNRNFRFLYNKFSEFKEKVDQFIIQQKNETNKNQTNKTSVI